MILGHIYSREWGFQPIIYLFKKKNFYKEREKWIKKFNLESLPKFELPVDARKVLAPQTGPHP